MLVICDGVSDVSDTRRKRHTSAGFVYKELSGGVWVGPIKGRLFKFDFPSANFWVSEPKDPPPPLTAGNQE